MRKSTKRERKLQVIQTEWLLGIRPKGYLGPLPRPKCRCNGFGCWGCLDAYKHSKQNTYFRGSWMDASKPHYHRPFYEIVQPKQDHMEDAFLHLRPILARLWSSMLPVP